MGHLAVRGDLDRASGRAASSAVSRRPAGEECPLELRVERAHRRHDLALEDAPVLRTPPRCSAPGRDVSRLGNWFNRQPAPADLRSAGQPGCRPPLTWTAPMEYD